MIRLFVGGLPRTATKDDLIRLFAQFGVSDDAVVLPRDRRTRRRKGFAYVKIEDDANARAAIAAFAGFEVNGKPLTVCPADERPVKPPRRRKAFALVFIALALQAAAAARAGQLSSDVGLTLNPVVGGMHESYNDLSHVPPIPIPLIELHERYGRLELELGGLPPLASVRSFDTRQGHTSTNLSLFTSTLRVWDAQRRFNLGFGQTLYNQSTRFFDPVEIRGTGETQFSRVTGPNYQAGYQSAFGHGRLELTFAYAPALHGIQFTTYTVAGYRARSDPERASQIDTALRYIRPIGRRADLLFGLRYVNYTAVYAERNAGLSDRNVGLLPVFGYQLRTGR